MFEIIKILVDNFLQALNLKDVKKNIESKKIRNVGTDLFVLYTCLNDIFITGSSIVNELERYTQWMNRKISEGKDRESYLTQINFLLEQQRWHLMKFVKAIKALKEELLLISPSSYQMLYPLIHGKINIVGDLIHTLSSGTLTVYDENQVKKFIEENNRKRFEFNNLPKAIENLGDLSYIGKDKLLDVENYLNNRNPREVLAQIENVLNDLHKSIKENFSVNDILIGVGNKKGTLTDQYMGF